MPKSQCAVLSENLVREIIREPKFLSKDVNLKELEMSEDNNHYRKDVDLDCARFKCKVRIRKSVDRPLNFSVILVYIDDVKREYVIVRYNGNHGSHRNRIEKDTIIGPHIHYLTERYQERTTHPDGYAEGTDRYLDIDGAIDVFLEDMNIMFRGPEKVRRLEEFE